MLLNDILNELQLTHSTPAKASGPSYIGNGDGSASLDQLDDAARDKYGHFLGQKFYGGDLAPMPDYIKALQIPSNIEADGNTPYSRRVRLTSGNNSDYDDDASTADFSLACDLLQDGFAPSDVEIIMRATRYRAKFDSMRGPLTYLERTINNALSGVEDNCVTPPVALSTISIALGRISIPLTPPPPREYVWQGRMFVGHAYALGGHGGASKSQAALQLAASIAMGIPFGSVNTKKGCSILIFGEDDIDEVHRRIGAYAKQENLTPSQRGDVEKNICALSLVGENTRLTTQSKGALEETALASQIIKLAGEMEKQSGEPIRLIVLDHAGLFHGGDFNAREDVSLTMRIINGIAHETRAAVLLLAHNTKSSRSSEESSASDISGSTTFVDQTRGAFILTIMRKDEAKELGIPDAVRHEYVSMAVVKNNYGKPSDVSWFSRTCPQGWEVGVLVPVDLQPPVKGIHKGASVEDRVYQFIAQSPGQYSKTSLRDKKSGANGALKASKPKVESAIDALLKDGRVITRAPTQAEISKHGLTRKSIMVLDVPSPQNASLAALP